MQSGAAASNTTTDKLAVLMDMGFSEAQAKEALRRVENVEDAIAILLNDQIQPSPPSSPAVSHGDSSEDEASYAANPRSMIFIINTAHPTLSFSSCLLSVAQASFDLYDQINANRSQLLSFKTWHNHGELKHLFECSDGNQLREFNQQISLAIGENHITTVLMNDPQHHHPVCLALFGVTAQLEQYTSQFKRLETCPTRFFISTDEPSTIEKSTNQ